MKSIASRQNAWFKRVRQAIRDHAEEIVIEGPKAVSDAIAAGWTPIALITRGDAGIAFPGAHLAFEPALFDALTETKTPQDAIGLFERPKATLEQVFARRDSIVVALDGVQDPGNVGTILRLAAAFDVSGVVLLPGCADPFGPKAIRASAGAILTVPAVACSIDDLARVTRAHDVAIFAADGSGPAIDPPPARAVLAFGSEGGGVSPALRALAQPIAIAMSPRVESLNVAAAAAILLWWSYALRGRG